VAEIDLMDRYPRSQRPIEERARQITDAHRAIARRFDREFFDGDRLTGYGGYHYHPRFWTGTVERFRDHYGIRPGWRILDVGCAKGFLVHDLRRLIPGVDVRGVDISRYALAHAHPEARPFLGQADCRKLPFDDDSFDLVICINTVHNLERSECVEAVREIERVSARHAYLVVDAYRNEEERRRLFMWNLTARTILHTAEWKGLFREAGYTGDYSWFAP